MYSRYGTRDDRAYSPEPDDYPASHARRRRAPEDPRLRAPPPSAPARGSPSGRGSIYDEDMAYEHGSSRPVPTPRQPPRSQSRAPPPRGYSYDNDTDDSEYGRPRPRIQRQPTSGGHAPPSAARDPARHANPQRAPAPPPPMSLPYRDGPPNPRGPPQQAGPRLTGPPAQGGSSSSSAAPPRAPAAAAAPPSGDTEIAVEIRDMRPLVSGDDIGVAINEAVKLALDLLGDERAGGFDALVRVGGQSVRCWRRDGVPIVYQGRNEADMRKHARLFIARLRRHFFKIILLDINKGYPEGSNYTIAMFDPASWTEKAENRCRRAQLPLNFDTLFQAYDPRDSGEMQINGLSIEFLASAWRNYQVARSGSTGPLYEEAYESFLGSMSLTIAHELVHAFLTFLGGSKTNLTPIEVAPHGEANELRGESGRMWEHYALGGMITPHTDKELGAQGIRAGALWLQHPEPELEGFTKVKTSAIRDLVRRRFHFPLPDEGFKSYKQMRQTEKALIVSEREWRRGDLSSRSGGGGGGGGASRSGTSTGGYRASAGASSSSGARAGRGYYDDDDDHYYSTRRLNISFLEGAANDTQGATTPKQKQPAVAAAAATGNAAGLSGGDAKQPRPVLSKLEIPTNVLFSTPPVLLAAPSASSPVTGSATSPVSSAGFLPAGALTPTATKPMRE